MRMWANGYLSGELLTGLEHVAGVFNGAGDKSHRADVPSSLFHLTLSGSGVVPLASGLDLERSTPCSSMLWVMTGQCQQAVFPNRDASASDDRVCDLQQHRRHQRVHSASSGPARGHGRSEHGRHGGNRPACTAGMPASRLPRIRQARWSSWRCARAICARESRCKVPAGQTLTVTFVSARFSNVDADYNPSRSLSDVALQAWQAANSTASQQLWATHLAAMLAL